MSSISEESPSSPAKMKSSALVRDQIVDAARLWIGVPFRHQGRSRQGLDCVGLINIVALELKLTDQLIPADYPRTADGYDFLNVFRKHTDPVRINKKQHGDLMVIREQAYPCHVAFWTKEKTLIHAYAPRRKVVEERYDAWNWREKLVACFSFRGI